jgi:hypothetical protein
VAASVTRAGRWLWLALGAVGRTRDTHMKMLDRHENRLFFIDARRLRDAALTSCLHHGRTLDSQERWSPASRHMAFLIAGLTKMRVTTGSCAASRTSTVRSCVHTFGSSARLSLATMFNAILSSLSSDESS